MAAPFSPETREAGLAALPSADLDLLVIGGGITGAAVARDAALRGLAVALVERIDWAAGTSSRSSKLIHGGVRYLQQGDVSLVREAAAERAVLRRIAPHLALPCRMLMPTRSRAAQAKLGLGLWTFERIAGIPADERYERWSASETLRREPTLDGPQLHGAVAFTEYLTDDARLVPDTVRGAHAAGARCAIAYPEVTSEDAAYLFEAAERTFAAPPLTSADVVATRAGLRPLLHEEGKGPSEISRRDEIMEAENGLVSIAGGKLTTHRRMAERVVDLVCRRLGGIRPFRTHTPALPNCEGRLHAPRALVP